MRQAILALLLAGTMLGLTPAHAQSVSFGVVVRIQAPDASIDPNAPSLQQVASGTQVRLTIYVTFQSLPANCQVSDSYTVKDQTGKTLLNTSYQHTCPALGGHAYWLTATVSGSGVFTLTGGITVLDQNQNRMTQTNQVAITVGGGTTPTPTATSSTPVPTATPTATSPATPTATPIASTSGSVKFRIISARPETLGAQPDWSLVKAPLTQIKAGTKLQLSVYYYVSRAPAGEPETIHWTVTEGSLVVIDRDFTDRLNASQPAASYRYYVHPVIISRPGIVHATVTMHIGGRTQRAAISFAIVQRVLSTQRAVSFSLDRLQVMMNGHPGTRFPARHALTLAVAYTVRNLRGTTHADVRRAFQIQLPGQGFRPADAGSDLVVAVNGKNVLNHQFTPQLTGRVRILVGITIGQIFHQRSLVITLTR